MATKISQSVSETPFEGNSLVESEIELLLRKVSIDKKIEIPYEFIKEINEYARRNSFTFDYTIHKNKTSNIRVCCTQCVKAHALEKSKQMKLGKEISDAIEEMFECETGHNGYYIDKEDLKKI